ncbi:tetratricopeptide repeat protein [Sphingomonas sp. MA1305]|uniref:tetratricopeptide repeat protein n=1 Tax=Sphingomonas sp. MA1305 TaxID=2479204 RepID=UPI001E34B339|nr:tetratricopeptide repeat protein [Sphingomonas sp. MA1305]
MTSVASIVAQPALADTRDVGRGLSAYMTARAADAGGRVDVAAAGYGQALAAAPADTGIALRAFREALAAGDLSLANRAAATLKGSAQAPGDLALLPLAEAAARGDTAAAATAVAGLDGTPLAVLTPSLRGWIAFAEGKDPAPALAAAAALKQPIAERLAAETGALLQIARGKTDDGLAAVQALQATGAPIDLRLAAAQLLFARGEAQPARTLIAGDDPVLAAFRTGIAARPTLGFGVSRLLARIAGDLAGQGASPLTTSLARTALIADPANDRARLLLASALAADGATDAALAQLAAVPTTSPFASSAAAARVTALAGAGREAEALALAKTQAERPESTDGDWQRYGDRLVAASRYAEAAPWYRRVLDAGGTGEWTLWLQYGGALDQAGDWKRARPALERAVQLGPAEPLALNYLGYAKAAHSEDVPTATRMLERAHALKPDDTSITDSLGWVYHLGGQTARGLPLVEAAAIGEPDNAEIGEHLGDLFWTLGRRYEARYAWRAAQVVADAGDSQRLAGKIANGLPRR